MPPQAINTEQQPTLPGDQKTYQLAIVIVSWNTCNLLRKCLETLQEELQRCSLNKTDIAVFVVDNNSSDGSPNMVQLEHPWVTLIKNAKNLGFAAANNQVLRATQAEFVLLLNPDTEISLGTIDHLIGFLSAHPRAGVVAPQLLSTDGSIQRSCRTFPTFAGMFYELLGLSRLFPHVEKFRTYKMLSWNHDDERQVDQPEGACLLIRKETLDQVGLLDEGYFMLFEEVDWCYRTKQAGWEIWFTPTTQVIHHYGQSIKQARARMILSSHRGLYRFWHKHYRAGRWYLDPIAYAGLMSLAYLRIGAYAVRSCPFRG